MEFADRAQPHTFRPTDEDLSGISAEVARAGVAAWGQVRQAAHALWTGNVRAAQDVVESDRHLDFRESLIEESCARFIARRQPAAADLRAILAAAKLAVQFERIGDESKKIARTVGRLAGDGAWAWMRPTLQLEALADRVLNRLNTAIVAYERLDAGLARQLLASADTRDAMYRGLMRQVVTYMIEDPRAIAVGLDVAFVVRALERIGEHVLNVAEHVIYIVDGTDVRHLEARDTADAPG